MLKFLTFAVKTQLNVHDLNNETTAGNTTDIRIMEFLNEEGKKDEAPAVSGRMLKHHHYEAMRKLLSTQSLCDACRAGEPVRPGKIEEQKLMQVAVNEEKAIRNCVIDDVHGYLIAQKAKQTDKNNKDEKRSSKRRDSRMQISWLMPVIGKKSFSKQVIHTRVSQEEKAGSEDDLAAQMIFNKSYASGIYAFVSALDIERIGLVESKLDAEDRYAIKAEDRKQRAKTAIEAYRYLISGQMGASLSHALPHGNPVEILVGCSENGPLPFPVSPMYSDFIIKTKGLMPDRTNLLYWGDEEPEGITKIGITKIDSIDGLFKKILQSIDGES